MTETQNIIRHARAALAKWRTNRFNSRWEVDKNLPFSADLVGFFDPAQKEYAVKFDDDRQPDGAVADLIVGTAGNPELLDAIDAQLAFAAEYDERPEEGRSGTGDLWMTFAERTAAAIVTADERMSA